MPLRIALLGGTNEVGSTLLEMALEAEHSVRLLTRSPSNVMVEDRNLNIIEGKGTNTADVASLIEGSDAVVCCAASKPGGPRIMKRMAENCIAACRTNGITRLLFVTALGVGGSSTLVRLGLGLTQGWDTFLDYNMADEKVLKAGFTAVRPAALTTKGEPDGKYLATSKTGVTLRGALHKADLALFLMKELTKGEWGGKAVQVYKGR